MVEEDRVAHGELEMQTNIKKIGKMLSSEQMQDINDIHLTESKPSQSN